MKIGLNNISMKADEIIEGAVMAEELGYDSIWYGEHIIFPKGTNFPTIPHSYGPEEFVDSFVLLSHIAAKTNRVRLATGIIQLPLRSPIMAARQILGVDLFSKGRLDVAVGLGWSQFEYDAAGTDMRTRGKRTDEMLELINDLFQPGDTIYDGKYYKMPQTDFVPKPIQKPRPPFLIGGSVGPNKAPLRRAARWDGFYGVPSSPANARETMDIIDGYRAEIGRENEPFEYVMVFHQAGDMPAPTISDLEGYFAVGVDRVVVTPWGFDYENALPAIEKFAKEFGLSN